MKKESKFPKGVLLSVVCLSILFAVTYSVPYIKSVFYDGMLAMTGVSNEKLGILMTIYGLGEILTPGIGGVLANKYNHRTIILISSLGTALACLLFALFPSFEMALVVWSILVFSTLFMVWGTLFKAIRLLMPDEKQGSLAGWFAGLIGLNYLLVNVICLVVNGLFSNVIIGMKAVFYVLAFLTIAFAFLTSFALKKAGVRNETALAEMKNSAHEKPTFFGDLKAAVKYKSVWYFGGTLFCIYSANITITYFTPYFTNVLGMTTAFAGIIAIVRTYGTKIIGAPVGGVVSGKIKSVSKTIIYTYIGTAVMLAAILAVSFGAASSGLATAIIVLVLLAAVFNNAGNGIQYALPVEGKVPVKYHAAAIGFGSALGFAPDLYQHVLFGYWIDTFGKSAYSYIFIYGIVASILGVALLILYNVDLKRQMSQTVKA